MTDAPTTTRTLDASSRALVSQFCKRAIEMWEGGEFIRMTLGKFRGVGEQLQVRVLPVQVRGEIVLQARFRSPTQDRFENWDIHNLITWLETSLGEEYLSALLQSKGEELHLEFSRKRRAQLHSRSISIDPHLVTVHQHNREKQRLYDPSLEHWRKLGVSNSHGKVKAEWQSKMRQVQKFLEVVQQLGLTSHSSQKLKVVDIGSGKSYLTFALYELLSAEHGAAVEVVGIERRADLVALCSSIAKESGLTGLSFREAEAAHQEAAPAAPTTIDLVVALHACDTATDDALATAVRSRAQAVIAAPCCHRYLRKKMKSHGALGSVLCHPIHEERFAAQLTDSLRSLWLQHHGYQTQVFEFIDAEHTDKNVMITGRRTETRPPLVDDKITRLLAEFGMTDFYLNTLSL